MNYCFALSFLWLIALVVALLDHDGPGANFACLMGGIFVVGGYIVSEIRKGRGQ